jgi:UDP-N-acetylmuramoyl-tripeptide--D-alanyl-D-alanine ligase
MKASLEWLADFADPANPDSMKASLEWLADFADPAKLLLGLGDMRELGDSALEAHVETLEYALKLLPGARLVAIGPTMAKAAERLSKKPTACHESSDSAAAPFQALAKAGDTVFIKASRGTRLELLEPKTP